MQCPLFPLFFEIYCPKVITNLSWIDFQRPFLGVLVGSTSKCHGYPLHSNKTIRREPFSAVLVICAGFLYSWQKTRIDFKDDSDTMYFFLVRILLYHELRISSSSVSLSVWDKWKESSESSGIDVVIIRIIWYWCGYQFQLILSLPELILFLKKGTSRYLQFVDVSETFFHA